MPAQKNNTQSLLQKRKGAKMMSTAEAIKAIYAMKHPMNDFNEGEKVKSLDGSKRIYRDGEGRSAVRPKTEEELLHEQKMRESEEARNRPPTRNELINTNYYLSPEEEARKKKAEEEAKRREEEAKRRDEEAKRREEEERKRRDEDRVCFLNKVYFKYHSKK